MKGLCHAMLFAWAVAWDALAWQSLVLFSSMDGFAFTAGVALAVPWGAWFLAMEHPPTGGRMLLTVAVISVRFVWSFEGSAFWFALTALVLCPAVAGQFFRNSTVNLAGLPSRS